MFLYLIRLKCNENRNQQWRRLQKQYRHREIKWYIIWVISHWINHWGSCKIPKIKEKWKHSLSEPVVHSKGSKYWCFNHECLQLTTTLLKSFSQDSQTHKDSHHISFNMWENHIYENGRGTLGNGRRIVRDGYHQSTLYTDIECHDKILYCVPLTYANKS